MHQGNNDSQISVRQQSTKQTVYQMHSSRHEVEESAKNKLNVRNSLQETLGNLNRTGGLGSSQNMGQTAQTNGVIKDFSRP